MNRYRFWKWSRRLVLLGWLLPPLATASSLFGDENLQISGQLLSLTAGEMQDGSLSLDYGLLDYNFANFDNGNLGLRLGRVKTPIGLYNDTRDVAFTRPTNFLPQSIYFDKVRNLELSNDGFQIYGDLQADWGDLLFQGGMGKPVTDENVEYAYLGNDWQGELSGDFFFLGRVIYELDAGRIRLSATIADGDLDFEPGPTDPFSNGTVGIQLRVLSFQYNAEDWHFTTEYMQEDVINRDLGAFRPDMDSTAEGYYLQLAHDLFSDWEIIARYDVSYLNRDDRDGTKQEAGPFGIPAHNMFAKDWTLGLRWDITPAFMVRGEYHWVDGTAWLSSRENNFFQTERYWQMFSLLASYRF
ncbi:MAG: hypothetical protein DIZ77_18610 [endosymbiont of Seepiophila jonesi]|uniref:Porin n=1 Tax=endosymbiont of Lamellibrachia luymesi TaxID=2200907 RepID=A0A370E117_9GAMM|nr:MAG: hypothetical protein DIZ77_18610 [endosymbiont of Seepiophila jonesi]RDH92138.1 MAG: hypothetical protein DIZ79_04250 [endosymbiont of Lamellibrachia luymesi]